MEGGAHLSGLRESRAVRGKTRKILRQNEKREVEI